MSSPALFGSSQDFISQGEALQWHSTLVGVHTAADAVLATASFGVALALIYIVRRESQVGTTVASILTVFAVFFILNAANHTAAIVTMWSPAYGLSGLVKSAAALVSVFTALAFIRAMPRVIPASPLPAAQEKSAGEQRLLQRLAEVTAAHEKLQRELAHREAADAEARQVNAVLQSHVAELQSLFKALPVGVVIATDAGCKSIRANEAFAGMMGLPQPGNTSLSAPPFAAPAHLRVTHEGRDLAASELPMQRAVAQNAPVRDFEQSVTRPDGVTLDVIVNAVPIRDTHGQPCGCVATFQDFSAHRQAERKRLDFERRLLQSQKLESIGVLAGGIAHDFNNLLTGVLGHANFARSELARGSTNVDHLLAQVETSAQRAADLCRQLLAYAGKGQIVVRMIDLNVAVQQAVPLLKLSIARKITLDLQLATSLPPLRGDPSQINQILLNLVTNASEAIGANPGTITLRTERVNITPMDMLTLTASPEMEPGSYACLEVRDTGCGISPETMAHIFEPFFTTKFVGRGLGLAAVIGIVQGHHGGIRVSSQVGAGTSFELFFPVVSAPARNTASPFGGALPPRGTILVVDDDLTVREFASAILKGASFKVVTAVDGEEALVKLRQDALQFDAVLLDLTMPKLDGEDTLIALRMISPNLPVVLTSGYGEEAVVQRFVGRGLADFLPKPFIADALLAKINTVIDRARETASRQ